MEVGLQVLNILAISALIQDWSDVDPREGSILITLTIILRVVRVMYLLAELKQFKVIFETISRFISPFYILILCLYCVYYLFAMVGMTAFGGLVTTSSH